MSRDDGITINCLTAQDTVNPGDMFPIWSQTAQDTRRVTGQVLVASLTPQVGSVTQYSAPSASPFTATVLPVNNVAVPVWLLITPTGTMANGTIALPPAGTAVDRQVVEVTCTQAVTTLAVTATGLNVTGAPITLAADAVFRMRYDAVTTTWYIFP